MKQYTLMVCLLLCFLDGCAVVDSQRMNLTDRGGAGVRAPEDAMFYYLPGGRLKIHVTALNKSALEAQASEVYVPDIQQACYFSYKESALSEDVIKIEFTKESFLSKISSTTEDKSPAIIAKVGELAKEGAKLAVTMGGALKATPRQVPDFVYDQVVNPFDPLEMSHMRETLARGAGLNVSFRADFPIQQRKGMFNASGRGIIDSRKGGIFYRPFIPYRITFSGGGETPVFSSSSTVYLPDEAPVLALNIGRAAFVKNSTSIEFENGVVKKVAYSKPSEVLGFVNIPIDLSKQLLSIPGELLTLRIDQRGGETRAVNAEKEYLQAENNYLKAQMELEKTKTQSQ